MGLKFLSGWLTTPLTALFELESTVPYQTQLLSIVECFKDLLSDRFFFSYTTMMFQN